MLAAAAETEKAQEERPLLKVGKRIMTIFLQNLERNEESLGFSPLASPLFVRPKHCLGFLAVRTSLYS